MKYYLPLVFILLGLILIVGTICNLHFLVDPPEERFSSSTFAFVKKYFGKKVLIAHNYFFGVLSLIVGLIMIYKFFMTK